MRKRLLPHASCLGAALTLGSVLANGREIAPSDGLAISKEAEAGTLFA